MPLSKRYLKSKPVCKVTFTVPAEAAGGCNSIELLGEFNNWKKDAAIAMSKKKDGSFFSVVDLPTGQAYAFRYLLDGHKWANDWDADKYEPSGVSPEDNSVVVV